MSLGHSGLQEWEAGLPAPEELIPLTQTLITPDLAIAFKIAVEPLSHLSGFYTPPEHTTAPECTQRPASPPKNHMGPQLLSPMQTSLGFPLIADTSVLRPINFVDAGFAGKELNLATSLWVPEAVDEQQKRAFLGHDDSHVAGFMGMETKAINGISFGAESSEGGSTSKKPRKRLETEFEDVDSNVGLEHSNEELAAARTLKRPRLVWTPQLHKRFVEAVTQLGIKNAVPKTIMQLMNVDGLTRENVASHLQKYRLYLKRVQGSSSESPTMSDHFFASTPLPPSLSGSPGFLSNELVPYLMPLPINGLGTGHIVENPPSTLTNTDFNMYSGLLQPFSCQSMNQQYTFDNHARPGSPQRQILTLFPPNGT